MVYTNRAEALFHRFKRPCSPPSRWLGISLRRGRPGFQILVS